MYFTYEDLSALIPDGWLKQSLDDDGSGDAEMFSDVQEAASTAVNAPLSIRYAVPVAATPFICRTALLIAAENCYKRRQMKDQFPYAEELKDNRQLLKEMARGSIALAPETKPVNASGGSVTVPSQLTRHHTRNSV